MAYTNSPLVTYTKLSPNHSGQRTHGIDRITPHCVVGQLTAAGICGCFTSPAREASCNYGIGTAGDIGMCVEEKNRSWCSSSSSNDQRAVTIECASDMSEPYAMNSAVYATLILLCTDICRRNGKKKLLWLGDKATTLNYSPKADEMVLTVHRWFANKSCPGDWLYSKMGELAAKVTAALGGDIMRRLYHPRYSIMCRQRLPEEVRWDDTVEQIFLRIKSDAGVVEIGMVQRSGIPMTNIGGLFTDAIGSTRKGRSLVNHHIMMSGN